MAGEWRETTLDQLGRIITGKTPPSTRPEYFGGDIPFVTPTDFDGRRLLDSTGRYLTEEGAESLNSSRIPAGAVMVSCLGSDMRKAAVAGRTSITNQQINSIVVDSGDDPLFVYYSLSVRKAEIRSAASGSAQPILNKTAFGRLDILLPPQDEQRAIAHILGTLDDKIELNRRMNETLEAMSRAIFQSWFVDFDPVRAKANGEPAHSICRRLGLTLDLLALFPESCQDSELGEIPTGWATVLLGSLCSRVSMGPFGSDIKTDNFVEVGVPVVRGGNLTDGFVDEGFVFISEEKADQLRNANARSDDIVITHRGTLGQVGLIPKGSRYPRYVVSQSQMVLSINPNLSSPRYIFEFLRSPIGQHRLLANASQVGVPAIARPTTNVKSISIVAPCIELLRAFEMLVEPMLKRVLANTSESMTLAALRDTLLPKLISGDLRVKDAARFMAEAGA